MAKILIDFEVWSLIKNIVLDPKLNNHWGFQQATALHILRFIDIQNMETKTLL